MKMRIGLVGLGAMGSTHFQHYLQMERDGLEVALVALCDVDQKKLKEGEAVKGNLESQSSGGALDFSRYALHHDMEQMIQTEDLDAVDLCIPTYLHGPYSIKAMELGVHVFCEKPMSLNVEICNQMLETAKKAGKILMIGHTLRYWPAYMEAKEYVDKKTFGEVISGYFYRGGETPVWSWENWLLTKEKSGGCLLDQHVHDVDTVNWLFGLPSKVSASGKNYYKGSGFDIVSTNYLYEDGKVINAQDDWVLNGQGYGFKMLFRLNFEKGALVFEEDRLTVLPNEGEAFVPELSTVNPYYSELKLFTELLRSPGLFNYMERLESHRETIRLALAEQMSAELSGTVVEV